MFLTWDELEFSKATATWCYKKKVEEDITKSSNMDS